MSNPSNVYWNVFDPNDELYAVGKDFAEQRANRGITDNIQFFKELPGGVFDIVHSASTLQYVEEDENLINFLIGKYQPTYFMLTRLLGGNIHEFVTRQNIGGFSTPCRFSNFPRIINLFEKCGYMVLLNAPCGGFEAGQFSRDIPKEMQIRRGVDLVFVKKK